MHPGAELSLLSLFLLGVWAVCASAALGREREKAGNYLGIREAEVSCRGGSEPRGFGMGRGSRVAGGDTEVTGSAGPGAARAVPCEEEPPRQRWQPRGIAQGAGNSSEEPFPMLPWPPLREQPLGSGSQSLPRDVRGSSGEAAGGSAGPAGCPHAGLQAGIWCQMGEVDVGASCSPSGEQRAVPLQHLQLRLAWLIPELFLNAGAGTAWLQLLRPEPCRASVQLHASLCLQAFIKPHSLS